MVHGGVEKLTYAMRLAVGLFLCGRKKEGHAGVIGGHPAFNLGAVRLGDQVNLVEDDEATVGFGRTPDDPFELGAPR